MPGAPALEEICQLPEYYPTRTETSSSPLCSRDGGIDRRECGDRRFGTGGGVKTRMLLEHLEIPIAYLPVDISRTTAD